MADNYDEYSKDQLVRLLRERDRRPHFGLVWERDEIDHDLSVNNDFVALDWDAELSCGDGPQQNLIIEGDNFDALRTLRMTHAGRVKCIYIDPPYNTGNRDFIYNDRFVDKDDNYRHSKWLEFMFRRLELAKELLTKDGVIFVSIDDNEVFHLGLLMEQVFESSNFLACIAWEKRYTRSNNAKLFYSLKDSIIVFRASPALVTLKETRTAKADSNYANPDGDPNGAWMTTSYVNPATKAMRPNLVYSVSNPQGKEIHHPTHAWKYAKSEYEQHKADNRLYWGQNGTATYPRLKLYLEDAKPMVPIDLWHYKETGTSDEGGNELKEIFGKAVFDNPKPTRLIERILRIATNPGDIILDFFAGSGTTAQAVMNLNKEDDGNRRFILVSSTEATNDAPDKNLCRDVCAERVRRVITGYHNKKDEAVPALGGGFAYLRCRRIPAATVFRSIQHAQIWTALQLTHEVALSPYQSALPMQTAQGKRGLVIYLPKISDTVLDVLQTAIANVSQAVVYSWQPALLAQRLTDARLAFEPIPAFLVNRFSARSGAKGGRP